MAAMPLIISFSDADAFRRLRFSPPRLIFRFSLPPMPSFLLAHTLFDDIFFISAAFLFSLFSSSLMIDAFAAL